MLSALRQLRTERKRLFLQRICYGGSGHRSLRFFPFTGLNMRVPIRKPGAHTFDRVDPYMTREKFDELKNKLDRLKKYSRPQAAELVRNLATDGDFSENAGYQMAKGRLRGINQRILEIEDLLKKAVLIKRTADDKVRLGSHVTIDSNGKQNTYLILGSSETNPSAGVISHNSPLGSALMGKRAGEIFKIHTANGSKSYLIIKIE
jgi:transcription elongation factor GreA